MLCVRKSQKLQNIMKINYVVKKFECIEIYKNIDDFLKCNLNVYLMIF